MILQGLFAFLCFGTMRKKETVIRKNTTCRTAYVNGVSHVLCEMKKNGAYFQADQIYSPRRGTPKSGPIRSIFNSDLSLTKTDVLSKFHQNRFIFTRVIVITNFRSETTTATTTATATTTTTTTTPYHAYLFFEFLKNFWFSARIRTF